MRIAVVVLFVSFLVIVPLNIYADPNWTDIRAKNEHAIVFLEITGITDPPGKPETKSDPWTATGFIVSEDGAVLTTSHSFPNDYNRFDIVGQMGSRFSGVKIPLTIVAAGDQYGLQLLHFRDSSPKTNVHLQDSITVPAAALIAAIGFPGSQDLFTSTGVIGSINGENGWWQTATRLDFGDSGSPVFDELGNVVAVVAGDIPGTQTSNYLIPINFAKGLVLPYDVSFAVPSTESGNGKKGIPVSIVAQTQIVASGPIERKIAWDKELDIRGATPATVSYDFPFDASRGYTFDKAQFELFGCDFCGPVQCNVTPQKVHLIYTLTSKQDQLAHINGVIHLFEHPESQSRTPTLISVNNVVLSPNVMAFGDQSVKSLAVPPSTLGKVDKFVVTNLQADTTHSEAPGVPVAINHSLAAELVPSSNSVLFSASMQ